MKNNSKISGSSIIKKPIIIGIIFSLMITIIYITFEYIWNMIYIPVGMLTIPTIQILFIWFFMTIFAGLISVSNNNQSIKSLKQILIPGIICGLSIGILIQILLIIYIVIGSQNLHMYKDEGINLSDYTIREPIKFISILIQPFITILISSAIVATLGSIVSIGCSNISKKIRSNEQKVKYIKNILIIILIITIIIPPIAIKLYAYLVPGVDIVGVPISHSKPSEIDLINVEETYSSSTKLLQDVKIQIKLNDTYDKLYINNSNIFVYYEPIINNSNGTETKAIKKEHTYRTKMINTTNDNNLFEKYEVMEIDLSMDQNETITENDVLVVSIKVSDGSPVTFISAEPYLCPLLKKYV